MVSASSTRRKVASISFRAEKMATILPDFVREVGGCAIIDGGLATELEANGADLNDPLWSAKCLISSPELIRKAMVLFHSFNLTNSNLLYSLALIVLNFMSYDVYYALRISS